MSTTYADLLAHLDQREVRYLATPDDERVWFMIRTEAASYSIIAKVDANSVYVSTQFPIAVPPGSRADVSEAILRANRNLKLGSFQMDLDDGEVQFTIFNLLESEHLSDDLAERLIGWSLTAIDAYGAAFLSIIYANETPAAAIRRVEAEREAATAAQDREDASTPPSAKAENGEQQDDELSNDSSVPDFNSLELGELDGDPDEGCDFDAEE